MKLFTVGDAKTIKGESLGYKTLISYMLPDKEICKYASKGCMSSCLVNAGRGKFKNVKNARLERKKMYKDSESLYIAGLIHEINVAKRKALKDGTKICVRLNGTSDIDWFNKDVDRFGNTIFDLFPDVQFYDYTKNYTIDMNLIPENYHLTFSRNEENADKVDMMMQKGMNVAVVFRKELPKTYKGYKVINGDKHDLRFLDEKNVIVGLTAKGPAKKDKSGFVVDIEEKAC